jgi:DNA-directed RNA polymerase specialized sigma24 family protein
MEPDDLNVRLASISTQWTKLFRAHQDQGDAATAAQRELLLRYYGAVYRYLLGTLRDPAAAEELTQEFAVRFLRGDFHRADPQQGCFRDFVRTALRHLAPRLLAQEGEGERAHPFADRGGRTGQGVQGGH